MSELPEFEKLQNVFKELLKGQLTQVGSAKKKKKILLRTPVKC